MALRPVVASRVYWCCRIMTEPRSALYQGTVRHRRLQEAGHEFCYRLFMVLADIDRLHEITGRSLFWSQEKPNIASFYRRDFLPMYHGTMREKVQQALAGQGFAACSGRILLLANWRYFGYLINPVSVYYCYDDNDQLQYLLLEVTNTPWKERRLYVLPAAADGRLPAFDKTLHVSPFFAMDMSYRVKASTPAEKLALHLDLQQHGDKAFDATLALSRLPADGWQLAAVLLRYPWMTMKVFLAIHWQALKLYAKKVTVKPHPAKHRS